MGDKIEGSSGLRNRMWHRRHHRHEWVDHIEFKLVERWKDSYLSGCEWRFSVQVVASFKGVTVVSFGARDMDAAMAMLPGKLLEAGDMGASDEWLSREKSTCSQPGCGLEPVVRVRPKRITAKNGQWLADEENDGKYYRQFCARHKRRGDCAREDNDDNYEEIEGEATR